ncbi:WXG100 family type VII secretion target [Paenibacillus silvae]|uniref:WXG100 family type VII secretion target n=1 Tax=Paenibacillus silvae TaxID=1325358 RepID=UPI002006201C|nr:WXG100 family type VII secretion target [Paenibacillus silvae]MCK6077086.1 WXG100 family type VII secretion target [Paenibacillus silvae]MCK6151284.1 WXG100 family type VII secretion target [Paenibacillus silvae]
MSRIQVTPERLFEAAREVEDAREQMEDTREELVRLIRWMESMWSGMVRERFLERFEENQPRMIETLESLAHIAKELREIGVRFQQADEVSGAAVAGNVATMSIGLKATQSNDGKGYQMKYDTYLRIWLPVNENGVTDQAALQAYERDHGKIDVTKMGQPPGANPALEQDLIQLQIEAFELGVHPFTGEPVTDDYAKMMISSLKWSQIVAGIGMVTGSMKSGKGPYKGRGTSAALDKVKQTIRDAKAKREQAGKSGKGTGEFNDPVITKMNKGVEIEFKNPDGNIIKWIEQNPKNISTAIESAKNSSNAGKAIEGKVGDFVQQKIKITGFGQEVLDTTGKKVTDLDAVTSKQIIEVKKSASAIKTDQIDRLIDPKHPQFFNYEGKEVIVYIDEAITTTNPQTLAKVNYLKEKGIIVVNSLEQLGKVLK